jgi:hypothetical protein
MAAMVAKPGAFVGIEGHLHAPESGSGGRKCQAPKLEFIRDGLKPA